jgi:MYXO-CTERM domain-containing protein
MRKGLWPVVLSSFLVTASLAWGADVTPDFSTIPTGWVTDRYQPASFANVGTYQGMNNVLGIGISSAQDFTNRPSPYQYTFYNTQGMQTPITGGAGSVLQAELYIPTAWGDAANGNVRTDMWGAMTDGSSVSAYPIIGFTNYGGAARLRAYDVNTGLWIDSTTSINYDAWTTLSIDFTGTSYVYGINGITFSTVTDLAGSTAFQTAFMQAYNFADPANPLLAGAIPVDYTAYWANTPEPGFYGALALGMAGLLVAMRRRRKASA